MQRRKSYDKSRSKGRLFAKERARLKELIQLGFDAATLPVTDASFQGPGQNSKSKATLAILRDELREGTLFIRLAPFRLIPFQSM